METRLTKKEPSPKTFYTEDFKIKTVQRIQEIGIDETSKEAGIEKKKLKGWNNKANGKYKCEICQTSFEWECKLKRHVDQVHNKLGTNNKPTFDEAFKTHVVKFAKETSVADAVIKYKVSDVTIRDWVKKVDKPSTCQICGRVFGYEMRLHDHMRKTHKISVNDAGQIVQLQAGSEKDRLVNERPVEEGTEDQCQYASMEKPDKEMLWTNNEAQYEDRPIEEGATYSRPKDGWLYEKMYYGQDTSKESSFEDTLGGT